MLARMHDCLNFCSHVLRMIIMERKYWARMRQRRQQQLLAEVSKLLYSQYVHLQCISIFVLLHMQRVEPDSRSSSGSGGSVVDVESVHDLHSSHEKPSQPPPPSQPNTTSESHPAESQPSEDNVIPVDQAPMISQAVASEGDEEVKKKEADEHAEVAEDGSQILDKPISPSEEQKVDKEEQVGEGEPTSEAVREAEVTEESVRDEEREDGDRAVGSGGIPSPPHETVVILSTDESSTEFTKILLEAFTRYKFLTVQIICNFYVLFHYCVGVHI